MIIGIDYSLTSPAMCVMQENNTFSSSKIFYLTANKKLAVKYENIEGVLHEEYYCESERYDNIAEFFLSKIPLENIPPKIYIEDYSFGSTGRVFHIAENAGHLKYKLWEVGYRYETVAPSVIKKYATGKGNADKQKMYDAFLNETGIDLIKFYSPKNETLSSPVTDIVDSYYIAKYGYHLDHSSKKEDSNGQDTTITKSKTRGS